MRDKETEQKKETEMIDCAGGLEHELVGSDEDDTDPDTCERCGREARCEDVEAMGYSLHLCEPCYRAAVHVGELV